GICGRSAAMRAKNEGASAYTSPSIIRKNAIPVRKSAILPVSVRVRRRCRRCGRCRTGRALEVAEELRLRRENERRVRLRHRIAVGAHRPVEVEEGRILREGFTEDAVTLAFAFASKDFR